MRQRIKFLEKKINSVLINLSNENSIFGITLSFFILLLIFNPPNKIIFVSFIILTLFYFIKIKNLFISLLLTFVASLTVMTGKTYYFQIIPPGIFQPDVYPDGYIINVVVTVSFFISVLMIVLAIRALLNGTKKFRPNQLDIFLIFFYFLKVISAFLISKEPFFSLTFVILSFSTLFLYFYVRILINTNNNLWKLLISLFSALVIFESILGGVQLINKSPLDKNIESQINLENFGNTIGETPFTFRPVGTFDHANSFGIWLAALNIILLTSAYKTKSTLIWIAFLIGFITMITTLSRSAWLGFSISFGYVAWANHKKTNSLLKVIIGFISKWRYILIPGILFIFLLFVIPRIYDSIYSFKPDAGGSFFRKIQVSDAIELIKLNPLLGIGTGMSAYEGISLDLYTLKARVPLEVHNWFIQNALETGLPSLFIIIIFIIYSLKSNYANSPNSKYFLTQTGVILCSSVAGLFQPFFNFGLIIFLLSLTNSDIITK